MGEFDERTESRATMRGGSVAHWESTYAELNRRHSSVSRQSDGSMRDNLTAPAFDGVQTNYLPPASVGANGSLSFGGQGPTLNRK